MGQESRRLGIRLHANKYYISAVLTRLCLVGTMAALLPLSVQLRHFIGRSPWPTHRPILIQLVFALLICEFFFYWVHRICHRTPVLWSLHSVHHGAGRVYWANSARFHPLDACLDLIFYFLPLRSFGSTARCDCYFSDDECDHRILGAPILISKQVGLTTFSIPPNCTDGIILPMKSYRIQTTEKFCAYGTSPLEPTILSRVQTLDPWVSIGAVRLSRQPSSCSFYIHSRANNPVFSYR